MRQRLAAALILAALTVACLSGCHPFIKVDTRPASHGSASGR